ncbi:MAG: hypothetical protein H7066_10170, partial [Cytophagaceae bacterium]|nr:hypothetical protein [Gemmatimonadaceae bacterium]
MRGRNGISLMLPVASLALVAGCAAGETDPPGTGAATNLRFAVSIDARTSANPLDGRVLVFIAADETGRNSQFTSDPIGVGFNASMPEPRYLLNDFDNTAQAFGVDVEDLAPGASAIVDGTTLGYPVESLGNLPAGEYWVQGMLHVYETVRRVDGKMLKLPMDRDEGQQWASAPGNLYSDPVKVRIDPSRSDTITIRLTKRNPPIEPAKDTKYVKHLRMKSELLSKFWGGDMYLGAIVVLPEG